jgi:2-oxoglutarate dehydrogenase E2 component (dihydrolipoamide succinyltransferase)
MATEIRVPTLGESVTEATIGKWFKKAGDAVKADEPLVELETDKVTVEVPAPAAGVLAEIVAKDGETVASARCSARSRKARRGAAAAPAAKAPSRASRLRAPPPNPTRQLRRSQKRPMRRSGALGAQAAAESGVDPATVPAPARMAASPRATCSRDRRRASRRPRRRSAGAAPRARARRPPPTMPRAKSA